MIDQQLFSKSEDDLLLDIGRALSRNAVTAFPRSIEQLKSRAEDWIQVNREEIRGRLCRNQAVRQLAQQRFR